MIDVTEDGLYVPAADIWIDPWKPVPRAVITHGHSDHSRAGMGEYHCTPGSAPIIEHRLDLDEGAVVSHDYGERWRVGDAVISFHPAGHVLGSAQIRVEVDGEVWVVSGDYKRAEDPSCEGFEVVECDTFITEATFGLPIYRWPSSEQVAKDIVDWWDANASAGRASALFCYTLGKAQRLLAELHRLVPDRHVYVHGAVEPMTEIYRDAGVEMLETRWVDTSDDSTMSKEDYAGELILAPPSASGSSWMRRFGEVRTAFASGWMRLRGIRRRRGFDHGFVLSDHVDWPGLLRTIQETGARRVLATHGKTDSLVRYLNEQMEIEAAPLSTQYVGEDED